MVTHWLKITSYNKLMLQMKITQWYLLLPSGIEDDQL